MYLFHICVCKYTSECEYCTCMDQATPSSVINCSEPAHTGKERSWIWKEMFGANKFNNMMLISLLLYFCNKMCFPLKTA